MFIGGKNFFLKKRLLGKILLERRVVTEKQLKHALDLQSQQKKYLGEILADLGYIEEHDVVVALVVQCHIPYIAIDKYDIDKSIIQLIPSDVAHKYMVIPLDRVNEILSIVMADPLDVAAKAEIKRITNCRLVPFIATKTEVCRAIRLWYDSD